MIAVIRLMIVLSIVLMSLPVNASILGWKFLVDFKEQSIANEDLEFKVENWICTVGKITVDRGGAEARRLGCSSDGKLQAYILPVCRISAKTKKPFVDSGSINLQMKKGPSKLVGLSCY